VTARGLPVRREASLPGTRYYLYEKMRAATELFQPGAEAAREHLKDLGYDSELLAVGVLDALVGLSLTVQNVEERILRVCKVKFAGPDAHHVQLCFGASDNANDLRVEKDTTVEVLKKALALVRAKVMTGLLDGNVELV
jgi:hypothetical protein